MANDQTETVAFLADPESYGLAGHAVERHATHGSFVFLAGDRAYKLKRAVRFPYMDYSTVARRKAMCVQELAVNRRLAPEIYIGTAALRRGRDGRLHLDDTDKDGDAVDWLVVMRRFDQKDLLESMRKTGALDGALMRELGERIAAFHGSAEQKRDFGGANGIATVIDENRALLRAPLDPDKISRLDASARRMLETLAPFLDARRDSGLVRRCHGDLHLNNICLFEGRPVPFDAIEFQDDFACIDVLFDLALLLMDLDRHGLRPAANALLNRYLERTGDYAGLKALPLFLSCRAAMRAHVVLAMAKPDDIAARTGEASHLLDCALGYLESTNAGLIAIGGVSGTGKSTLAAALAPDLGPAPGAMVIRSDVIRKRLWGAQELARLPPEAYEEAFTDEVYRAMTETVSTVLSAGHSVIVDAVFGHARQRSDIEGLADRCRVAFQGLWLDAPARVLEARIAARRDDASDADARVLRAQLARIVRPDEWIAIDARGEAHQVADRARKALKRTFAET